MATIFNVQCEVGAEADEAFEHGAYNAKIALRNFWWKRLWSCAWIFLVAPPISGMWLACIY